MGGARRVARAELGEREGASGACEARRAGRVLHLDLDERMSRLEG